MALSQRPAARFFAAFYRWNLQRPQTRSLSCQYSRDSRRHPASGYLRKYHATRLLRQQGQLEPQLQDDGPSVVTEGSRVHRESDTDHIDRSQPATAAQEELVTEQNVAPTASQESPPEPVNRDAVEQELKEAVRGVFRKVPNSVAVITVASVDPKTKRHVPMGVAVSSLSSVTLDPPTISFNIKEPSKTLDAIRAANGLFRVHFPAASRGGANVVELFCRGNHPEAYRLRHRDLKLFVPSHITEKEATTSLAPQIRNETICAAMDCTVTHEFPIADHVILAARVDSMEHRTWKDPTISYVDGKYVRSDSTIVLHNTSTATESGSDWSVWDCSLSHSEEDRKNYLEHIRTIINRNPEYLNKPFIEATRDLEFSLPYSPSNFGIEIYHLLQEYRQDKGHNNGLQTEKRTKPVFCEFYGRLTPRAIARIIDRAKRLIKEDSAFLRLNYKIFLLHLGVNGGSRNLLPSDIMNALRAEGLVGKFVPSKGNYGLSHKIHYDLEMLEQIELKLREGLRNMYYLTALNSDLETIVISLGFDKSAAHYFMRSRPRLVAESHPEQFDSSKIDIVGEVSQGEARVVLSRIIRFLHVEDLTRFQRRIRTPPYELLRLKGVHPTISGMDIDYLFAKLYHLYQSIPLPGDFTKAIDELIEPWLERTVKRDDLEKRFKEFVQKAPLRATSWTKSDSLAAMGFHWDVVVMADSQNVADQQPLSQRAFATLIAKELLNHYGNGTEEENKAIAEFLKETYNFDVHRRLIADAPQDSTNRSSSDELEEAVQASLIEGLPKGVPNNQKSRRKYIKIQKHLVPSLKIIKWDKKTPEWDFYSLSGGTR
ncbi:Nn.00g051660.m01.CDS01 [Neocucurbitaria sp. VM-36]